MEDSVNILYPTTLYTNIVRINDIPVYIMIDIIILMEDSLKWRIA